MSALLALISLFIELAVGYPDRLYRAIGHPVTWIGGLISWLDRTFNRETDSPARRRLLGTVALLIIVALPTLAACGLQRLVGPGWTGLLILAVLGSSLVAQRSLASHVRAVADKLDSGGLPAGRKAVSQIVGRDPDRLDQAGVCRAAIESLAENYSDGVIAPAFWMTIGGLPGGVAYKAANTADSMIGHRTPRHQAFGWAAARSDDLINLPCSRLTALLIILAALIVPGADAGAAWKAVWRDARKHRSPNAGWPESAMAGALGLSLAGPRVYGGVTVEDAEMGAGGRREASADDIRQALRLYWAAQAIFLAIVAAIAAAMWF